MRQLMIWAVQAKLDELQADAAKRILGEGLLEAVEALLAGLLNNTVNTSWYQRPVYYTHTAAPNTVVNQASKANLRPNPANTNNVQCLQLLLQYQTKYSNNPLISPFCIWIDWTRN